MKFKTLLVLMLVVLAGCSFSKKPASEVKADSKSRVDEVMDDSRYTARRKLEVAIVKGDAELFYRSLPLVPKTELNIINDGLVSLTVLALQSGRADFLEALLKAGASPFFTGGTITLYEYTRDNTAAQGVVKAHLDEFAVKAEAICLKSDLQSLINIIEEYKARTNEQICSGYTIFTYYLAIKSISPEQEKILLDKFWVKNKMDDGAFANLFIASFIRKSDDLMSRLFEYEYFIRKNGGKLYFDSLTFDAQMNVFSIEQILKTYAIKKSVIMNSDFHRILKKHLAFRIVNANQAEIAPLVDVINGMELDVRCSKENTCSYGPQPQVPITTDSDANHEFEPEAKEEAGIKQDILPPPPPQKSARS